MIPKSETLSTSAMNRVFDSTTATYKFYWLLSLLDMHVKEQKEMMLALDVASRMVAYAWYPIEYFKLSFGKGDSMSQIIPDVAWGTRGHVPVSNGVIAESRYLDEGWPGNGSVR